VKVSLALAQAYDGVENARLRARAEAAHGTNLAAPTGRLERLQASDAKSLLQRSDPRKRQDARQLQHALRHFGSEPIEELRPAGAMELLDNPRKGRPDAR
jgi:hypothetical protein